MAGIPPTPLAWEYRVPAMRPESSHIVQRSGAGGIAVAVALLCMSYRSDAHEPPAQPAEVPPAAMTSSEPGEGSEPAGDVSRWEWLLTTETLRRVDDDPMMQWRYEYARSVVDGSVSFEELAATFHIVSPTREPPSDADMRRFTDFQLQVIEPPGISTAPSSP